MTKDDGVELYCRLMAIQAGVVALLRTSENPALPEVLDREIEKMKAILLGNPLPEQCIDAFEQQLAPIRKAVT